MGFGLTAAALRSLRAFLSVRFLKFAAVGASGVGVNLGVLWLLVGAGLLETVASAAAIYVSILSNFALNEWWTFGDRRADSGTLLGRCLRFQAVSFVGALMQWVVFVLANVLWLRLLWGAAAYDAWVAGGWGQAVTDPPAVGAWLYVSQLCGIGVATGWNFLANFHWTWGERSG